MRKLGIHESVPSPILAELERAVLCARNDNVALMCVFFFVGIERKKGLYGECIVHAL